MTDVNAQFQTRKPQFNRSLTRTIIFVLLFLTIIPVAIIGGITYFRSTNLIRRQTTEQLISIGSIISDQLEQFSDNKIDELSSLADDNNFRTYVSTIINPNTQNDEKIFFQNRFDDAVELYTSAPSSGEYFDQIFLVDGQGLVIYSPYSEWQAQLLSENAIFRRALRENQPSNYLAEDFNSSYNDELIVLTIIPINDISENNIYLVGLTADSLPNQIFATVENYYPNATAAFRLSPEQLILKDTILNSYDIVTLSLEEQTDLNSINQENIIRNTFFFNDTDQFLFSAQITSLNSDILIAMPEQIVLAQVEELGPFNLFLFLNLIIISGIIVYYGTSQIINPLRLLSESANRFAKGELQHRAKVNRRDEIGLLAYAFNQMVEQLSSLYRSLEEKVTERTQQMNTTSQIAQLATSATSRDEIISNAVTLLTDHFGFTYAGIYLHERLQNQLALRGYVSNYQNPNYDNTHFDDLQVPLNQNTSLVEVFKNGNSYISNQFDIETRTHYEGTIIPTTRSIAQLPIKIGDDTLGVLDIQADRFEAFDNEFVSALEALASQIGSGIRNIGLLEATQFDLASTNVLYQTTKEIGGQNTIEEIDEILNQALERTDYVTAIFNINENHLRLVKLNDQKDTKFHSNIANISIPLNEDNINFLKENYIFTSSNLEAENSFKNLLRFFSRRGCNTAALLPINKLGEPVKLLALASRSQEEFDENALDPFINLSEVAGNAIEKIDHIQEIENRKTNLEILTGLMRTIGAEDDLQLIFHTVHNQFREYFGEDINLLFALYDQESNFIEIPYAYENKNLLDIPNFELGEGLTSYVIQNQAAILLDEDVEAQALILGTKIVGKPAKTWMGFPLVVNNQTIGAVVMQDAERNHRYSNDDLALMQLIEPHLSAAIFNAREKQSLSTTLSRFELDQYLFNSLLSDIPDHIAYKDTQGQYIRVSESFANAVNLPIDEILGKTDMELFGSEFDNQSYLQDQQVINEGIEIEGEIVEKQLDKQTSFTQHYKKQMVSDSKQPIGLFSFSKDITELKTAENIAQNRASQIQTASEIARDTSGTLDLQSLLQRSVNLVRERFGFYHASIFLIDPLGEYAVLEESTGEAGRQMKAANHRLAVGSQSTVGAATATREPVVNNDVTASVNYYPNPLLPDTRAELAIPLIARNEVLGAIDVQSVEVNAFLEEDIQTLQILADQLATAILNAKLFALTEDNLSKHRFVHQISRAAATATNTEEAYQNIVQSIHTAMPDNEISVFVNLNNRLYLRAIAGNASDLPNSQIEFGKGVIGEVALYRKPIKINDTFNDERYVFLSPNNRSEIALPIEYGERLYGVLNIEAKEPAAFDDTDQEIFATLAANIASTLSVIELIDQINLQSTQQRQMYEAANKIRRSPDMKAVLETSVNEISRMLGASKAKIKVYPSSPNRELDAKNNGNGHRPIEQGDSE